MHNHKLTAYEVNEILETYEGLLGQFPFSEWRTPRVMEIRDRLTHWKTQAALMRQATVEGKR